MTTNDTLPAKSKALSATAPFRSGFSRELVLVLVIKFALIVAIKLVFFSHPVSKNEVVERMDKALGSTDVSAYKGMNQDLLKDHP